MNCFSCCIGLHGSRSRNIHISPPRGGFRSLSMFKAIMEFSEGLGVDVEVSIRLVNYKHVFVK